MIFQVPIKLIMESSDYTYEMQDPMITIHRGLYDWSIEAKSWAMTITKKEKGEKEEMLNKESKIKARKDRFPKDGGKPVKASVPGYSKIPWFKSTLTLIAQSPDGQIHYAKTNEEKKEFAWSDFDWIIVCWPGVYSQDIFLVDDVDAFRRALGFKPRQEAVFLDEDGEEWVQASKPIDFKPKFYDDAPGY